MSNTLFTVLLTLASNYNDPYFCYDHGAFDFVYQSKSVDLYKIGFEGGDEKRASSEKMGVTQTTKKGN